jgi:hypothetical protein
VTVEIHRLSELFGSPENRSGEQRGQGAYLVHEIVGCGSRHLA